MVIFDSIILDTILICMPLAVYLLYIAYSKAIDKRENNLLLVFTIFTILYLLLKYSKYQSTTFLIINIPLLISYLKKNKPSIHAEQKASGLALTIFRRLVSARHGQRRL